MSVKLYKSEVILTLARRCSVLSEEAAGWFLDGYELGSRRLLKTLCLKFGSNVTEF